MILQGRLLVDPRHVPEPGWLRIEDGRIAEMAAGPPPEPARAGDEQAIVCPGFVDAHLHPPQFDAVGCDGMDLLAWLEKIVYPLEATWADPAVARDRAITAWSRLLRAGTLGFAAYLTAHPHALEAAAHATHRIPLRVVAGQVLMDRHGPAALIGHRPAPLDLAHPGRLAPSVNPRFAVSCTDGLLAAAARLGETAHLIQTHLAESTRECALVRDLFPHDPHYTAVYDRHRLLGPRTLLAHALHLRDEEWALIAERGSVVVHCPTANLFLESGLFDLRRAREHGVRLAIGSDVAAGPDLAMPRVARGMIETAKMRRLAVDPRAAVPSPEDAWDLITRGNADALGFTDAGRLEPGAPADLLVLRVPFEIDHHYIGRLIHTWSERFIADRIVDGRLLDPDTVVASP